MSYSPQVWGQIKNLSAKDLIRALENDGWIRDEKQGAIQVYRHPDGRRVTIHFHPGKTYGPGLLKAIFKDIGWKEEDFRRLKLIKG